MVSDMQCCGACRSRPFLNGAGAHFELKAAPGSTKGEKKKLGTNN